MHACMRRDLWASRTGTGGSYRQQTMNEKVAVLYFSRCLIWERKDVLCSISIPDKAILDAL